MIKIFFLSFIFIIFNLFHSVSFASSVVDPHLQILQRLKASGENSETQISTSKSGHRAGGEEDPIVGLFIKTEDIESLRDFLNRNSGSIQSVIGDIVTAKALLSTLPILKTVSGVQYLELAQPLEKNLDVSLGMIGADIVHRGSAASPARTGQGVIIGIVDSGIDWRHFAFRGSDGRTRVKTIWDQSLTPREGFVGPREILETYGLECLEQDLRLGFESICPSKDWDGHGTHVAGIAAGSDTTFKGVAPAAEIIAVKLPEAEGISGDFTPTTTWHQSFSNHLVDAVSYIFQKASSLRKPSVVNISLGTHFGPHDSTSLFEQALNRLAEAAPGRSIVAAAGNEARLSGSYFASLHAGFSLSGETKAVELVSKFIELHALILDIWQPIDSNLSFGVGMDDFQGYQKTSLVSPGNTTEFTTQDGKLRVLMDASENQNPLNGKKHAVIYIVASNQNDGVAVAASKYVFDLIVSGSGSFDAWVAWGGVFTKRPGVLGHTGFSYQAGDSQRTIAVPATASKVIAVASHVNRNNQNDLSRIVTSGRVPDISSLVVGNVSSFSSLGPTISPELTGQKPEISAPGEWVLSAMSSDAEPRFRAMEWPRNFNHVLMAGTSMASPHVAGAAALLLERDSTLTWEDVEKKLCQATVERNSGEIGPNNRQGFGHLNISTAMTDFASDHFVNGLPTSGETIAEVAYDGGATDNAMSGVTMAVTAGLLQERSTLISTLISPIPVAVEEPEVDIAADPLEPSQGGCSLLSRGPSTDRGLESVDSVFLFLLLFAGILFLLRKKNGFYKMLAPVFFLLLFVSCGGGGGSGSGGGSDGGAGGGGGSNNESNGGSENNASGNAGTNQTGGSGATAGGSEQPNAPITLLTSLNLSGQHSQFFWNEGYVTTSTTNFDRTKLFILFIPLKHFFRGETLPLGADGLYGFNDDEASLVIYEGRNFGSSQNPETTATHVAISGSVSLQEASVKFSEAISGSFEVRQIVPMDRATLLIQRGVQQVSLNSSFSAFGAQNSKNYQPVILDYSPKSAILGQEVVFKGFNFDQVRKVRFRGCGNSQEFSFRVVSENEIRITIDRFGCLQKDGFYFEGPVSSSDITPDAFEVQLSYLQTISLSSPRLNRFSYDSTRDTIYFTDTVDSSRLRVFSIRENKFLMNVYVGAIEVFDILADGSSLIVFDSVFDRTPTRYSLEGIGTVNSLSGTDLNLSNAFGLNQLIFGKGQKGLVATANGLRLFDLNTGTFTTLPPSLNAEFYGNDKLLRSRNRSFIVLNASTSFRAKPTVVYRTLDDGGFERISVVRTNDWVLGVAEQSQEFWSETAVYDLNLARLADLPTGLRYWDSLGRVGVAFNPAETHAILITKMGFVHILDRATKRVLASEIPILNVQNKEISASYFMSRDGTKLLFRSFESEKAYLRIIDLPELFQSVGLAYP